MNGKLPLMKGRLHLAPLLNMHGEAVAVTAVYVRIPLLSSAGQKERIDLFRAPLPSQDGLGEGILDESAWKGGDDVSEGQRFACCCCELLGRLRYIPFSTHLSPQNIPSPSS
jgi:hypothetical protein